MDATFLNDFRRTVDEAAARLVDCADEEAGRAPAPGKWSKKEVIGHLIDSAANNHVRFVRAQATDDLTFDGYDRLVLTRQQFPSSKGPVDGRIDVTGRGPGFAVTRYQGLIDATLIGCSTPIDDETTQVTFLFTLRNPGGDEHTVRCAALRTRAP